MGRRLLLPKLSDVVFVAVFLASIMLGTRMLNTDGDLGRDLTLGSFIISSRTIPTVDILSWSKPGQSRPPYEWLAQVALAAAARLGGLDAVVVLVSVIIAAAFAVVCKDACGRSAMPMTSLLLAAWAAVASSLHWLARPHVFSLLFFALWVRELENLRRDPVPRLWVLPVLMLVWANTHGGFVFGFAAWLAYMVGWLWESRRRGADPTVGRRLLLSGGTSLIASMITPDLWGNWRAVLANRSAYILSQTAETQPPRLSMPGVWPFLLLLATALVLAIWNGKRARGEHVLLLAGLAIASLLMARNIPLFAIAAAPVLALWARDLLVHAQGLQRWEGNLARMQSTLRGFAWPVAVVVVSAGFLILHRNATHSPLYEFQSQVFPVEAADWALEHRPAGQMFNDLNWGGYLLYRLWPGERVYIDSQTDFYGEKLVRRYAEIMAAAPGWELELHDLQVGWLMIPPTSALAGQLRASAAWREPYQDATAAVFVRAAP